MSFKQSPGSTMIKETIQRKRQTQSFVKQPQCWSIGVSKAFSANLRYQVMSKVNIIELIFNCFEMLFEMLVVLQSPFIFGCIFYMTNYNVTSGLDIKWMTDLQRIYHHQTSWPPLSHVLQQCWVFSRVLGRDGSLSWHFDGDPLGCNGDTKSKSSPTVSGCGRVHRGWRNEKQVARCRRNKTLPLYFIFF